MKLKTITLLALLAFIAINVNGFQREKRKVENFDRISVSIGANVYVKIGSTQILELDGDEEDLEDVETVVENGVLKIRDKRKSGWSTWNNDDVDIYITVNQLNGVSISSSARLEVEGTVKTGEMYLKVSGSGKITADIEAEKLDISISGSGSLYLSGTSETVKTSISGSGRVKAEELATNVLDSHISGSGSMYMTVNKELEAHISGSGRIYYRGNPDRIDSHTSGSGSVRKL